LHKLIQHHQIKQAQDRRTTRSNMTGWGVFWNVYRRGMTTQAQVQSKRMNKQAAAIAPQQQTAATRSMANTSAAATTPNTTKSKEEEDYKAWVNEWDDVSLYAFLVLYLR
jgi:hypothetical protein